MIYINGNPLNITLFPDNTSQVWKLPDHLLDTEISNWVSIRWDFSHEGEFMQLAQLQQLLQRYDIRSSLKLTYLPYGRQDKEYSNTSTFALKTFSHLLNSLEFEEVIIVDPHSQMALDLITNSRAVYPSQKEMDNLMDITKSDLMCYPDKGAAKKYDKIYESAYICGAKVRDQTTGDILNYSLKGSSKDKRILIVDDICDGGATFVKLSKLLYLNGAKEVNLFVTHGIFSKGLRPLLDAGIKRIFTQNGEATEINNNIAYRRI